MKCTPNPGQKQERGIFFMKYDLNFKLDCVGKYKEGRRDFAPTKQEELRLLRERNTVLEAENLYLKK